MPKMKFTFAFFKSVNFWLYIVFFLAMCWFAFSSCSRSTTPPRVDCPAPTIGNDWSVSNESEVNFAPVDTMPAKRDHCPHDLVSSTMAYCTPPGAKCNVCKCLKCGVTWPCN